MAWECKNKFWHGTRTYMMSGRKNPTPKIYTASLTANAITQAEKNQLINCVRTWPGHTNESKAVMNATITDIQNAQATG
ncbi:MAG: hypothetical protein ACXWVB_05435 [Rhodoplanes sp.]